MNDFTKEELEDIENGLGWLCEHNPFHKVEIGRLMTKVKSMIDSYCEHEWDNHYEGSINTGIYCNKCSKKLRGS